MQKNKTNPFRTPAEKNADEAGRKFRIMLINSVKFLGGGEVWMLRMGQILQANGHQVVIVARPDTPFFKLALNSGVPTEPLTMSGDLNPIALWHLARLVRKYSNEIVVTNMSRDIRLAGLVSLVSENLSILALHQVDRPIEDRWNYRLTFNFLSDAMVVNSQSTKQTLRDRSAWLDQNKICVIPHAINPAEYRTGQRARIREEIGLPQNAFVAGFVGRLCKQKGISVLLPALEKAHEECPEAYFVIAGTGGMEADVEEFLSRNGLREKIRFLGFRDDIPALMQSFDVLLVPSLWEGFGLVLIEAMAAGVPCIASRVSSIPEIVQDGVNGLLIPPGDADALIAAIRKLHDDPKLREKLATGAGRTVDEKFATSKVLCAYEKVFSSLRSGTREIGNVALPC